MILGLPAQPLDFSHDSFVCSNVSITSIFAPVVLTLLLLSSCSTAWKRLDAVWRPCLSTGCFRLRVVLLSTSLQVASKTHVTISSVLFISFFTYFWRSSKSVSSLLIGPLFGAAMGQEYFYLQYFKFLCYPNSLISTRIIWWYVDTRGSMILML